VSAPIDLKIGQIDPGHAGGQTDGAICFSAPDAGRTRGGGLSVIGTDEGV
jgi:hypothetical protein